MARARIECAKTIGGDLRFSFGKNQPQGGEGGALCGLAGFFEPKQAVGKAALERVLRFAFGDSEEGHVRRPAAQDAARLDFGQRVFEILRNANFLERFVRKLFGEDATQLLAIGFAREVAGGRERIRGGRFPCAQA
jgi:hypothetical protein